MQSQACLSGKQVLGVKHISIQDIINLHILPAFKAEDALSMKPATAVSYLSLILCSGLLPPGTGGPSSGMGGRQPEHNPLMEVLKQHAVLATNQGLVRASTPFLHFPGNLQLKHVRTFNVHTAVARNPPNLPLRFLQCCSFVAFSLPM